MLYVSKLILVFQYIMTVLIPKTLFCILDRSLLNSEHNNSCSSSRRWLPAGRPNFNCFFLFLTGTLMTQHAYAACTSSITVVTLECSWVSVSGGVPVRMSTSAFEKAVYQTNDFRPSYQRSKKYIHNSLKHQQFRKQGKSSSFQLYLVT